MSRGRPFALTAYPLSHGFRSELERSVGGELEYLSVPELRRLSVRPLLSTFARLRGRRCIIPLEDPGSTSILPLLEGVATAALPASIEIVHSDLRRERVSRRRVARTVAGALRANLQGVRSRRAAAARLALLLGEARHAVRGCSGERVVSINANLWFGVKAGGSLAHTSGVANGFSRAGYAVDLFTPFEVPHLRDSVTQHRVSPPRAFAVPTELNYFRHDDALLRHVVEVLGERPRFVYQRLSIHSHAGVRLSRSLGVPLVLEYNGSEVWVARHWGQRLRYEELAQQAEDALLRHSHVIVTVSDVLRKELLDRGLEKHSLVTYPNCVDTELFDPGRFGPADRATIRARHGIAGVALVVTFVGTFGRWHGTDVLARTIRRLVDERADWLSAHNVHFLLVGDGLRMPEVERTLAGRSGRFHTLAGLVPQEETPAYLAASDIVVSPHVPNEDGSRFFGSPTKLFEYLAMGLPVVASELDQIGDVLQPSVRVSALPAGGGEPGAGVALVTTPGSEAELADGIRYLVEHPAWRAAHGTNARRLALERYTWDAHVGAILERIDEVCG